MEIAEAGEGNLYYIASPGNLPEIFRQEFQGLLGSQKDKLINMYVMTQDPEIMKEIGELELNYQYMAEESFSSANRKNMSLILL
ncbi:MAG: hypothetical protein APF84_00250 [Gracilibacter sp. BRH_c7a]|nr:MAG: hypothetical protein APF84_00250 [Gracilibacter sp. BRH_c7a]